MTDKPTPRLERLKAIEQRIDTYTAALKAGQYVEESVTRKVVDDLLAECEEMLAECREEQR
jgi:hypothetical protein